MGMYEDQEEYSNHYANRQQDEMEFFKCAEEIEERKRQEVIDAARMECEEKTLSAIESFWKIISQSKTQ